MDPPTQDASPQDGVINVSDFSIRGESALDRVVAGAPNAPQQARTNVIEFSQARAEFTRTPGRMAIRDGVRARADDRRHGRRQHRLRAATR